MAYANSFGEINLVHVRIEGQASPNVKDAVQTPSLFQPKAVSSLPKALILRT